MPIWKHAFTLDDINRLSHGNMLEHLGVEFVEIGDDFLKARMPVDERTKQPAGLLHGGASVVMAESLGSTASYLCIDYDSQYAVGIEINANHLRPVTAGHVIGEVRPLSIGKTIHVWDIKIRNDQDKLTCVGRLTTAVRNR